ncbi:MAG TPA: calcineurin-like phosphoesterase family protein [Opitutaceae bacterium]|nr:calcineurin-like phosphoesterase family protein [Opitutaceae bacterium]HND60276.1 calcineurin-like phosphoesterase family protein [Opitutaceae bacterium]
MTVFRLPAGIALLLGATAALRAASVHGVVYDDRNGNGVRDPGEPGLAQVTVSDGEHVALTDADGTYQLAAVDGALVFVVKPRDWHPSVNAQQLPQFFRRPAADGSADFPLQARAEGDRFKVLLLADPQPASLKEVGYFDQTIVQPLVGGHDFAFSVSLGDVVYDRHELYPPLADSMARLGIPAYRVNGNHDLDLGAKDDRAATASFEQAFGPSTYAFHHGRALFIALNDVRFLGGPRYVGGIRPDQLAFIENLLRLTPRDELVVLMFHIPWFYPNPANAETFRPADRARLFALLRDRPNVLWLSGHTHYQRHYFYGRGDGWEGTAPLHEYNVAAACGSYWGGPPDASGIPVATMNDGTPHGYGVLTVDGVTVRTDYRAARHPADYQISLHVPKAAKTRTGYISYYANVFNGHEGWTVESRVGDRQWNAMRRVVEWDPTYAEQYLAQDALERPLATPRLPDPTVCYHLWRSYLPADLAPGTYPVDVRATDPAGTVHQARGEIRIVAVP